MMENSFYRLTSFHTNAAYTTQVRGYFVSRSGSDSPREF
jgi:hypothetical protein